MSLCLYNNKVAPDLSNNQNGKLKGRGLRTLNVLRNCTNSSQKCFAESLRDGRCAFVSPLMETTPKKRKSLLQYSFDSPYLASTLNTHNKAISINVRTPSQDSTRIKRRQSLQIYRPKSASRTGRLQEGRLGNPFDIFQRLKQSTLGGDKLKLRKYIHSLKFLEK